MALSATSMADRIVAAMDTVEVLQIEGAGDYTAKRLEYMVAMCQGIIDEIQANGQTIINIGSSAGSWPIL